MRGKEGQWRDELGKREGGLAGGVNGERRRAFRSRTSRGEEEEASTIRLVSPRRRARWSGNE